MSQRPLDPAARAIALRRAVTASLGGVVPALTPHPANDPPAQQNQAPRNTAQQIGLSVDKTNPTPPAVRQPDLDRRVGRPRPLTPRKLACVRLLLTGRRVADVAGELCVHPYTVTRWLRDPAFQAELRRQVSVPMSPAGATRTNTAQQGATTSLRRRGTNPM